MEEPKKEIHLFLGCGPLPIHKQHLEIVDEGWTLIDKYVKDPGIVNMDIRKLEYSDESVDEIYCSHTLEHIGLREVIPTLKEWHRVLKPGGKVTINVPDMEWAAGVLLSLSGLGFYEKDEWPDGQISFKDSKLFDTPEMLMEVIYGNQDHEGEFHKSGYTAETLKNYLVTAGFGSVDIKNVFEAHEMGCLIAEAIKK